MSAASTLLNQVFTRKMFAFAGNSLLVYDYFITLSLEITYIWDAPWTVVKTLFLINRYGNLIGQTFIMLEETGYLAHNSQKFCAAFGIYSAVFSVFSGESIRLLVVMRACAIMGCKHRIAVLANILYVLCAIVILAASLYWSMSAGPSHAYYLHDIGICFNPMAPNFWLLWLIPFSFDVLVMGVVCCSLYRATSWSRGYTPSRLIRLLARDAFLFYFAASFNVLFFIVCWNVYREDPRNALPVLITFPILSVVGQRLVFNLRRFRTRPDSMRDLSREIRRQVAAMGAEESECPSGEEVELTVLGSQRPAS